MAYLFAPPPLPALAIAGRDELYAVTRIFCVGRNYAAHALEMGGTARDAPFFFMKPASALVVDGTVPFPPATTDFHHEVELVVALGSGGRDITPEEATGHVFGYSVGIDMTRRDLQNEMKRLARPWEVAKSFEASAPIGPLAPAAGIGHPASAAIRLQVNGKVRQDADIADMTWSVPEIIGHLSGLFELGAGDIIMTGTPAGVGAVARGDRLHAAIAGIGELDVRIV
jgi:fumarylpyruvate hydrolase